MNKVLGWELSAPSRAMLRVDKQFMEYLTKRNDILATYSVEERNEDGVMINIISDYMLDEYRECEQELNEEYHDSILRRRDQILTIYN